MHESKAHQPPSVLGNFFRYGSIFHNSVSFLSILKVKQINQGHPLAGHLSGNFSFQYDNSYDGFPFVHGHMATYLFLLLVLASPPRPLFSTVFLGFYSLETSHLA
jgi:hypothetical protein